MKIVLLIIILFILFDIGIVGYIVYRRLCKKISRESIQKIKLAWKAIIREKDMRHGIMEADKLLDHTLSLMGYRGNLGNKLKKSGCLFRNLNGVWAAHKIRNNIAHQINYRVDEKVYRQTMLQFKQAFLDLKIF